MIEIISEQNKKEIEEAEKETDNVLQEIFSFELEALEDDPEMVLVTKSVSLKKVTVAHLKELHTILQVPLPSNKKKPSLFQNLRDSGKTKITDDTTFEYDVKELPAHQQKGPRWEILAGVEIEVPSGFHPNGVEEGFFAPTNKDNDLGEPMKDIVRAVSLEVQLGYSRWS
jgi:hypothetical protein